MLGMAAALWLASATSVAAVSVSPSALYIDHRSRSGTITLYNPGSLPAEVDVSFAFGYPVADAEGRVSVPIAENAPAGEPSVVPWLRAFPKRLVLEPGQRQVVRILVQPPANLPDGEYWGRVLVSSRGGQPPIEQTQGDVRVQLNIETVVVTAVTYRKGDLNTGVRVQGNRATPTDGGIQVDLDLDRDGSAAYIGRARVQLVGAGDRVVAEVEDNVAVYRQIRRRFLIPVPAGTNTAGLTVRYLLDTERADLPVGVIKSPLVSGTIPLTP